MKNINITSQIVMEKRSIIFIILSYKLRQKLRQYIYTALFRNINMLREERGKKFFNALIARIREFCFIFRKVPLTSGVASSTVSNVKIWFPMHTHVHVHVWFKTPENVDFSSCS